jgi:hypothetical protein
MILSFIQDIEHNPELSTATETVKKEDIPDKEVKAEPERIDYSFDNSFESKYIHFKKKIEKDRLAWETLAGKK